MRCDLTYEMLIAMTFCTEHSFKDMLKIFFNNYLDCVPSKLELTTHYVGKHLADRTALMIIYPMCKRKHSSISSQGTCQRLGTAAHLRAYSCTADRYHDDTWSSEALRQQKGRIDFQSLTQLRSATGESLDPNKTSRIVIP